jgi:hypothetical protein
MLSAIRSASVLRVAFLVSVGNYVKVHHPAAKFDIQFVASDDKLDDVGILTLVCGRFPVSSWHGCQQ